MAIINWPINLTAIDTVSPYLEGGAATPGTSITGQDRFVETKAAKWRYGFTFKLWSVDEHLSWRLFCTQARSRANLVNVKICGGRYSGKITGYKRPKTGVPYSDGSTHSDGSYFAPEQLSGRSVGICAPQATSMRMSFTYPVTIMPGQDFSDGFYFYRIERMALVSEGVYDFTFYPGLRQQIDNLRYLYFENIRCLMRMTDEALFRAETSLNRHAVHRIDFVEAIP